MTKYFRGPPDRLAYQHKRLLFDDQGQRVREPMVLTNPLTQMSQDDATIWFEHIVASENGEVSAEDALCFIGKGNERFSAHCARARGAVEDPGHDGVKPKRREPRRRTTPSAAGPGARDSGSDVSDVSDVSDITMSDESEDLSNELDDVDEEDDEEEEFNDDDFVHRTLEQQAALQAKRDDKAARQAERAARAEERAQRVEEREQKRQVKLADKKEKKRIAKKEKKKEERRKKEKGEGTAAGGPDENTLGAGASAPQGPATTPRPPSPPKSPHAVSTTIQDLEEGSPVKRRLLEQAAREEEAEKTRRDEEVAKIDAGVPGGNAQDPPRPNNGEPASSKDPTGSHNVLSIPSSNFVIPSSSALPPYNAADAPSFATWLDRCLTELTPLPVGNVPSTFFNYDTAEDCRGLLQTFCTDEERFYKVTSNVSSATSHVR